MLGIWHIRLLRALFLLVLLTLFLASCNSRKPSTVGVKRSLQEKYALQLQVKPNEVNNTRLYSFIDEWYGVPYKYAGIDKSGIDCSGFICVLYEQVYEKKIPRSTKDLYTSGNEISREKLQEGDLVFFKIENEKPSHVGVYLINNKFVHASSKKGIMISDLQEPYFIKYFYCATRLN